MRKVTTAWANDPSLTIVTHHSIEYEWIATRENYGTRCIVTNHKG